MRIVVFGSVLLAACSPEANAPVSAPTTAEADESYSLKLSIPFIEPVMGDACNVHFEALNTSDKLIGTATVKFAAANAQGETVADGFFVIANLRPQKTQNGYHTLYKVPCSEVATIKNVMTNDSGGSIEVATESKVPIQE